MATALFTASPGIQHLTPPGHPERADALFPTLLVYDRSRISIDRHGILEDPGALSSIYVTDRILASTRISFVE